MELNSIIITVYEMLLTSGGRLSVEDALESAGVSRRTLTYNLKKLNYALRQNGSPPVVLEGDYIETDIGEGEAVLASLLRMENASYILSGEERRALIFLSAGLIGCDVMVERLCDMMQVSKNTILGDVGELKTALGKLGIQWISKGRQGYSVGGDELSVRYCLYEHLSHVRTEHTQALTGEILSKAVAVRTGVQMDFNTAFGTLCDAIEGAEQYVQGKYSHNTLTELAYYLLLALCRQGNGSLYVDDEPLMATREYEAAGHIMRTLAGKGLAIGQDERAYIAVVLLGARTISYAQVAAQTPIDLNALAADLVDTFEAKACVTFEGRAARIEQFLLHLRPLYYRLKYQIKVANPYADKIRREYSGLYGLTESVVHAVGARYGLSFPDEEIAYICVYFTAWLKYQHGDEDGAARRILIVCGAGVGTSLLLYRQITDIIGTGYRFETKDLREALAAEDQYDLIITTVELPGRGERVMRVSPMLTGQQKEALLAWSFTRPAEDKVLHQVEQVLQMAEQYATINNRAKLAINLRRFFETGGEMASLPGLWDVLTPDMLRITGRAMGGDAAVRLACECLLAAGCIGPGYADSILGIVEQMGLYSEIYPGMLLAHARPSAQVYRVGLSLTLFRRPARFEQQERDISVILTLCTPDNHSHMQVLQELMQLLGQKSVRDALLAADFRDAAQLNRFLHGHMPPAAPKG